MPKLQYILDALEGFSAEIETQNLADAYGIPREVMDEPYEDETPEASDEELVAAITSTLLDIAERVTKVIEEHGTRSVDGIAGASESLGESVKKAATSLDAVKNILKTSSQNTKKAIAGGAGQVSQSITDSGEKTQAALDGLAEALKELHQEQPRALAKVVEAITESLKQPEPAPIEFDLRRDADGLLQKVYAVPVKTIPSPGDGISLD